MNATNFTLQWTKSASKGKILVRCDKDGKLIHNDEVVIGQHSARNRYADQLANLGLCRDTAIQELLSISDEATKSESSQASSIHSGDEIEPDAVHRPERFLIQGANSRSVPILKQPTSRGDLAGSWVCYVKSQNDRQRIEIQGLIRVGSESIAIAPIPSDPDVMNKNGWSRKSRETWLRGEADIAAVATLQRLVSAIDHFLDFQTVLQRGTVLTLALWAFATYHYHAWSSLGYLLVNGPGNSGKSTVFRILREIVFRPFATDNTSAAAVFRTLHSLGGTLLYDEAERLRDTTSPDIQEINSMLLAGYQRGRGATRLEKVGDGFKQVNFQVFGPKALACINGVSTVLQSRCIVIHTQRAAKSSPKPKRPIDFIH